MTILNANILQGAAYADDGAAGSYYVITKLTEAEMTLARQGDGWQNTWVFKLNRIIVEYLDEAELKIYFEVFSLI